MQPYLFPYLGYFQLLGSVDRFVLYDDVAYRKRSWVNRNRILVKDGTWTFSVPLSKSSQNRDINQTDIHETFGDWRNRFMLTMHHAYSRAPHFESTADLVEQVLSSEVKTIADLCHAALAATSIHLGVDTPIVRSAERYNNRHLSSAARMMDICRLEGAEELLNLPGGESIYDRSEFASADISLKFLNMNEIEYDQGREGYVSHLSIIDVLMYNSRERTRSLLTEYSLS
ncbi:MAG: WbqC family protein [Candidatus Nanopelagicales bacterium]